MKKNVLVGDYQLTLSRGGEVVIQANLEFPQGILKQGYQTAVAATEHALRAISKEIATDIVGEIWDRHCRTN